MKSLRYVIFVATLVIWILFLNHIENKRFHPKAKFALGDCIEQIKAPECEKWQHCEKSIFKVLEVGSANYRCVFRETRYKIYFLETSLRFTFNDEYEKVNCPDYIKGVTYGYQ